MATRQQPPRPPAAALRRRRRRAYVFLLPLLLVVVLVLLCPAGRVHAALASAEGEKRDGGNQKQHPEQQDRDLGGETGEEDRQNDSSSSSSSTSGDAEAGAGGGQRPTFTALHGRSRAELEGEGYQCFPTGECIECTEEEMVGGCVSCLEMQCVLLWWDKGLIGRSIPRGPNRRSRTARRRSCGRR